MVVRQSNGRLVTLNICFASQTIIFDKSNIMDNYFTGINFGKTVRTQVNFQLYCAATPLLPMFSANVQLKQTKRQNLNSRLADFNLTSCSSYHM
jgi:hypothetical protein